MVVTKYQWVGYQDQERRDQIVGWFAERGYDAQSVLVDGLSEEGFVGFVLDEQGERILDSDSFLKEDRVWVSPEHWDSFFSQFHEWLDAYDG